MIAETRRVYSEQVAAIAEQLFPVFPEEGAFFSSVPIDTTLTIAGSVESGSGVDFAIDLKDGDDTVDILSTGTVIGGIDGGDGTDAFSQAGGRRDLSTVRNFETLLLTNGAFGFGPGTTEGNLTVQGGTLAPGASIGTLTVNGDLVLDAASTFEVEVDDMAMATL